jgi:hypothetical protein
VLWIELGLSTGALNKGAKAYRESCLTKVLSAWTSLASIKYLEEIEVAFNKQVRYMENLRKKLLPKFFDLLQVLRKNDE